MKHVRKIVTFGVGVAVASYVCWWGYHVSHYSEWVSNIKIGDSKAKVLANVGRPVIINTAPDHLWCSDPEISYEYMYGTAVVASWEVIGFNKDGKVVCKQELQSP